MTCHKGDKVSTASLPTYCDEWKVNWRCICFILWHFDQSRNDQDSEKSKNLWWFYWYLDLSTNEHRPNQTGWRETVLLPKGCNFSLKFRRAFHSSSLSSIFYWYVHPLTHDTYTSLLHLYLGLVCEIFLPFNFSQFSAVMAILIQVALTLFSKANKSAKKSDIAKCQVLLTSSPVQQLLPLFTKISSSRLKPGSFPNYLCKNCLSWAHLFTFWV